MLFYPQYNDSFAQLGNMIATGIDSIEEWFESLFTTNENSKTTSFITVTDNMVFSRQRNEGRDTGLRGIPDKKLEEKAREAKGKERNRLIKELKMRGLRNVQKKRGGPSMRGLLYLLLLRGLKRSLDEY